MATYFVFGNSPKVNDLLSFTGKDIINGDYIKIEEAENKAGHCFMNINNRMVGVQITSDDIITAIYPIDCDSEGVRLLTILIEQWSTENSEREEEIAMTVIDEEMSLFLEYI
jgi:hypothetical protein